MVLFIGCNRNQSDVWLPPSFALLRGTDPFGNTSTFRTCSAHQLFLSGAYSLSQWLLSGTSPQQNSVQIQALAEHFPHSGKTNKQKPTNHTIASKLVFLSMMVCRDAAFTHASASEGQMITFPTKV